MNYRVTFTQVKSFLRYLEEQELLKELKFISIVKAAILQVLMDISPEESINIVYSNAYFADTIGETTFPRAESINKLKNEQELNEIIIALRRFKNDDIGLDAEDMQNSKYSTFSVLIRDIFKKWKLERSHSNQDQISKAIKLLHSQGYCIIPNVLTKEECEYYKQLLLELAEREKRNGSAFLYGKNGNIQRIYHLVSKLRELNSLIINPVVTDILDEMFYRETWHDRYYLCSWHSNIIPPGGERQKVHIDVSVPDPIPPWIIRMNTNFLLQDYTKDNGCTIMYPGTHKLLCRPSPEKLEKMQPAYVEAASGSLVLWSGHVWHASGDNSTNEKRIAVLGTYSASFMREMCNEEDNLRIISTRETNIDQKVLDIMGVRHGIKYNPYLNEILQRCM